MPDKNPRDSGPAGEAALRKFAELNATGQLGVMAHRISHDLRGPLASLSAYFELEQDKAADPAAREAIAEAAAAVEKMAATLHRLTRLGRAAGPSQEAVPLAGLLAETAEIAALLPGAGEVAFSLPAECPQRAAGSRSDLQQALFNLVKNAVEAVAGNAGEKRVSFSVEAAGKAVRVLVSDNGPGLAAELAGEIFKSAVSTREGRAGLGLLIARDLLLRNGGDLRLADNPRGGLTAEAVLRAA